MNGSTKHDGVDEATLGRELKNAIVLHGMPVARVAKAIGASRQTIYNWMRGGRVFCAYRPHVRAIIRILQTAKTKDEAWSKICQEFSLLD
jgi:transcriptional regulator with XRE-family HTH domain